MAEDNEINQVIAAEIVRRAGFDCDVVSDGSEALKLTVQQRYDLVLMDCQMPRLDGFAATQSIRERERELADASSVSRHLPIVALTANAVKGDRERCLNAGMDGYVSKPIDPSELIDLINALLEEYDGVPPPAEASPSDVLPNVNSALPPNEAETPPVDLPALLRRCLGDRKMCCELLTMVDRRLPDLLDAVRTSLDACDATALATTAHALKGVAANISASSLTELARHLETGISEGDLSSTAQVFPSLKHETARLLGALPRLKSEILGAARPVPAA